MATSYQSSNNDSEQKRLAICLELGIKADTSWEELCSEIPHRDWLRKRALFLGLPPDSTAEAISFAFEEQVRNERCERLGLPADATTEQILELEREEDRVEQATEQGLPPTSTWQEIAESLWQQSNSQLGTKVETENLIASSTSQHGAHLALIIFACGLLLLAPIPVAFPLRLCFTGAAIFIARRLLRG